MSLTVEQRREINRANSQKSTGPKTDEGKARSRQNAKTHGMRAEVLAMINEDPAAVAARTETWNTYYQPESPGAQHLVDACVRATFLSDRVARSYDAVIDSQVRKAENLWSYQKLDELAELRVIMIDDPALGLSLLRREAIGCDHLAERWKVLFDLFLERGSWTDEESDESIHLIGVESSGQGIKHSADAFKLFFFNALCTHKDRSRTIKEKLVSDYCPDALWKSLRPDTVPDRENCQKWIIEFVKDQYRTLSMISRGLTKSIDDPDRAGAKDRALILQDEKQARLFLRYNAEARNGFQRAFGTLLKTLQADTEKAEDSEEIEGIEDSPNEADADLNEGSDASRIASPDTSATPESSPRECPETASPNEATFEAMEPTEKEVTASPRRLESSPGHAASEAA